MTDRISKMQCANWTKLYYYSYSNKSNNYNQGYTKWQSLDKSFLSWWHKECQCADYSCIIVNCKVCNCNWHDKNNCKDKWQAVQSEVKYFCKDCREKIDKCEFNTVRICNKCWNKRQVDYEKQIEELNKQWSFDLGVVTGKMNKKIIELKAENERLREEIQDDNETIRYEQQRNAGLVEELIDIEQPPLKIDKGTLSYFEVLLKRIKELGCYNIGEAGKVMIERLLCYLYSQNKE
jgi:hypothetical protein